MRKQSEEYTSLQGVQDWIGLSRV